MLFFIYYLILIPFKIHYMVSFAATTSKLSDFTESDLMKTRPIMQADYAKLEEVGGYPRQLGRSIKRWLERGLITEADCYVFDDGGTLVGGVCLCDDTAKERQILDFALDTITSSGHEYLTQAVQQDIKPHTCKVSYNLYNDTEQYADILRLFHNAGFTVEQEKLSYAYEGTTFPPYAHSLYFRSISEVGEEQYVTMVEGVTRDTLDQLMAADAVRLGSRRAAQEYVDGLKELDFNPDWWKLGYNGDTPVGLILPQRFNENLGAINYVGVLPEHRGKGYGLALLAEGTRLLIESGVTRILADIDVANRPLAAQMERLGYVFQADEVVLVLDVNSVTA